jgi:hypothetical protein
MRRFFIEVSEGAFDTLADLAIRERRAVRDQAALVLEGALASPQTRGAATLDVAEGPNSPVLEPVA